MRNLKKFLAVLITVAMLASMMVPALAASYESQATVLNKLGLLKGDATGNLMLDSELTRIQGITLTIRAMGAETAAMAMTEAEITAALANVTDAATIPAWGRPYAAYAVANGITNGVSSTAFVFAPVAKLSGQQFITMMLRAMGYTGDDLYANAAAKAAELGMLSLTDAINFSMDGSVSRDVASAILYGALTTATATGETLLEKLVAAGAVDAAAAVESGLYVAPTAAPIAVESVTASNLVEATVVFTGALDEDEAEDDTNYTIDGVEIGSAEMLDDGMSVLLTLDVDAGDAFDNAGEYTLEIDEAIVEAEVDFVPVDDTLPVAESIELTGPTTVEVTFSEPIASTASSVEIDINDGEYSGDAELDNSNVIVVDLGNELDEGEYEFVISGAEDFAGLTALKKTFTLNYVEDTTAPVPEITDASETEVVIDFGENVEDEDGAEIGVEYFYHSYTDYAPDSVEWDGSEVTLTFDSDPLPEGTVKVVVNYDGGDSPIQDLWGNEMESNAVLYATVVADTTAPTITDIDADDENTIIITFSEDMDESEAEDEGNYTIEQDGDDIDVDFTATYDDTDDDYTVTLDFDEDLDGEYTVTVTDLVDEAFVENTIVDVTLTVTVSDSTGLDLADDITVEGIESTDSADDVIIVRFSDDMIGTGANSVLDLDNYLVKFAGETSFDEFDEDNVTIAFFNGNDAVKISIDDGADQTVIGGQIQIARVADVEGNLSSTLSATHNIVSAAAPYITNAEMTSYKVMEVTFEGILTAAPTSGFTISYDGETLAPASSSYTTDSDDNETVVKLVLKADTQIAQYDSDNEGTSFTTGPVVNVVASKVKADTGVYASAYTGYAATDAIAPTMVSIEKTTDGVIAVEFTEALSSSKLAYYGYDLYVEDDDGDELDAGDDYAVTVTGNILTITLTAGYISDEDGISEIDTDEFVVGSNSTVKYIEDVLGNNAEAFDNEEVQD